MKHCEKHNQDYMDHLEICPVCLGEKLIDFTHPEALDVHKQAVKDLKNGKN